MLKRLVRNPKFKRTVYFFPFQLFLVHLKKNLVLLLFWVLLFSIILGTFGEKYGVPYLLLYPEYLGKVGFWSFFILGFSCGGFIIAFNITSYIMHGFRFPFLATVAYPFTKYSLNNFLVPTAFVLTYLVVMVRFHLVKEYSSGFEIFLFALGFISGLVLFLFFALGYFVNTNKDIFKIIGLTSRDESLLDKKMRYKPVRDILHKNRRWQWQSNAAREWPCLTYLSSPFKIRLARDCEHYDRAMLNKVFNQNHVNAAFFEVLAILSLIVLGLFREYNAFMIPAGATLFLLFTTLLMLSSAVYSWFRGWSNAIFVVIFLFINFLSKQEIFHFQKNVYGINYQGEEIPYSNERLHYFASDTAAKRKDFNNTIQALNNWKEKAQKTTPEGEKPRFVMICSSGGGLRASLWTFYSLLYTDSILNGSLLDHTALISGSSGGMIGSSFMRALYEKHQRDSTFNMYHPKYHHQMGMDMLNPVAFTIATNDLFFRFQSFKYNGRTYKKDRAFAFEKALNDNTGGVLDRPLYSFREAEFNGEIPIAVFAPTIINDGRRLLVSAQPMAYMTDATPLEGLSNIPLVEDVEFTKYFGSLGADSTRFTSLLRMNATFPYIFPIATLPSEPGIEVMDGGIRDNYGLKSAMKFLFVFREWIKENTSGVVLVQTRDKQKQWPVEENARRSILQSMTSPLGSFYVNFDKIQNFNHDELLQYASLWFEGELEVIDLSLENEKDKKVSMSWHLTEREKVHVLSSINLPENRLAIQRLDELLNGKKDRN